MPMKVKNSTRLKHLPGHVIKKLIVPSSKTSSSQHKIAHPVHHTVNSSIPMPAKKIRTVKKIKTTKVVNKTVAAHRTTIKPVSLNSTTSAHKYKKVLRVVKRKKKQKISTPTNATSISPAAIVHGQQSHPVQHNPVHKVAHKPTTGGVHQRVLPIQHKTASAAASTSTSTSAATSSVTSSTSVTSSSSSTSTSSSTSSASGASAITKPTLQPITTTTSTSTSTATATATASASTQTSTAPPIVSADSRNGYLLLTPGNNTDQSATLSVSHDVSFMPTPAANLGQMIHNKAGASGLVSMSGNKILDTTHTQLGGNLTDLKPPPQISNEVIQWLSKERIKNNEQNLELFKDIDGQRQELVSQRQANAARQMKIVNRVSGALMRESFDNDLTDRLFQSEQRRHESLRDRFSVGRTRLNERAEQLQRVFSGWKR